ncbi:hypothetical protein SAMN02745194_01192 [Roseomonas rosea]|uniref:Uncharacterized protein n=1 Tax=Muricoccus roseus TaxID=198092 RepID=A0A1M6ECM3_9PROT|nr:hypothetical protein [Roseomonas rosea]SHI83058.1 hypothetical protein SAMN02745194_01192 [Roseomonas rosea]
MGDDAGALVFDSATKLDSSCRGRVCVAASHGGIYVGHLAAKAGVAAVIVSDAGIGREGAGVAGLALLDELGIPAGAASHLSARIGDGQDLLACGVLSRVNGAAMRLGLAPGLGMAEAQRLLRGAPAPGPLSRPPMAEARFPIAIPGARVPVIGVDSNSLVQPGDAGAVVVTGSHGGLLGGRGSAVSAAVRAAVYNDAGIGKDEAGVSRLPALEAAGIAGLTVSAESARIGDARSTFGDGIVSRANAPARRFGVSEGMTAAEAVARIARD